MIQYLPWTPIEGLEGYFWFESLIDNASSEYELVMNLSSENTKRILNVAFKSPLSYKKTSSFDFVNADTVYRGVFLQVENSPYLLDFLKMSHNNWKDHKVTHYSFRTNNYVIDVLSAHDFYVTWSSEPFAN